MTIFDSLIQQSATIAPPQPQVLGIGGSPRKGGNSDAILQQILIGAAKQQLPTENIHLRDMQYQGCIGCERCRKDKICTGLQDGMSFLYPDILKSQGLVLVCPTHNYNITSWMKAFIDRLYCFYNFTNDRPRNWSSRLAGQGRKAIIAAICEQENKKDMGFTLEAMRLPLEALGYDIIDELPVLSVFDKKKVKEYEEVMLQAEKLGAKLGRSMIQ
ncbi:flavodoxin family protein [Desulfogranum marinum]|uniref:flavodoxin family protein n=1 Tax=Desulfogranum marinum TaxID=453220 RepID=UPI0019632BA8|nr:flavodoxin family protein [Desulfogranum marinum]MBM9512475.1 flavodoxin family protein [Desulfogranum marinum]